jgi:hypothetical protein
MHATSVIKTNSRTEQAAHCAAGEPGVGDTIPVRDTLEDPPGICVCGHSF